MQQPCTAKPITTKGKQFNYASSKQPRDDAGVANGSAADDDEDEEEEDEKEEDEEEELRRCTSSCATSSLNSFIIFSTSCFAFAARRADANEARRCCFSFNRHFLQWVRFLAL